MKIAVYGIALNEAKHVKRFMEACKGADLVVIADTGSTDGTQQLFTKHGATVHHISVRPFRFDDARNAALALVPADVDICVSLDIDEVPDPDFFDKLREAWKPDTTRAFVFWNTDGQLWANNNRVHQRYGYRWIKPCHEVTTTSMGTIDNEVVIETTVTHEPDNNKSRAQYLPMLKAAIEEEPHDARMWHYYIRELYFHKKWKEITEAIDVFLKGRSNTGWNIEFAASCRAVGDAYVELGDDDSALEWFLKGTREAPDQLETWLPLAHWYYRYAQWEECLNAANKVNELTRDSHYLVNDSVWKWRMFDLLAISSWNLGKRGSAKKWARLALEGCPIADEGNRHRLNSNYEFMLKGQTNES